MPDHNFVTILIRRGLGVIEVFDHLLVALVRPAVVILGIVIGVTFAAGVLFRSALDQPLFGLEELILLGVMWFYFLGAGLASSERSHLSADFIPLVFGKHSKTTRFCRFLATVISLLLAFQILAWSWDLFQWGFEMRQATPVFHIPWFVSQLSLVLGAMLFILYLGRDLLRDLQGLLNESSDV